MFVATAGNPSAVSVTAETQVEQTPKSRNYFVTNAKFDSDKRDKLLQEEPWPWLTEKMPPTDLLARVNDAVDCSGIDLEGLTFEEKCDVLAIWIMQNNVRWRGCFGLVDVTQDGCPEFFTQNPSYEFGTCVLYDISEEHPKEIAEF